ncbi:MAG: 30S ribosomal protein S2 [Alphaproteobacteria bacterium]|nr:30S ribosomal protein S2 [Alphaproteobacteria bacterium]
MPMPVVKMKDLLEAGVHFGHHTRRWNPKMQQYIFGVRNGIHILDLQQTTPMMGQALQAMRDIVAKGGRVLFVGTKHQAKAKIAESAKRCGQYYVNHRWLGGMMTNWKTISNSITRLREVTDILAKPEESGLKKKELLMMEREREKLELALGGIKDMGGQPDALFVIDVNQEDIAVMEANKLGIPVFAILDSNSTPDGVDYPIPGNDDAIRAISFYCDMFSDAILDGLQAEMASAGKDIGAAVDVDVKVKAAKKATAKAEAKSAEAAEEAPKAEAAEAEAEAEDVKKAASAG